MGIYLQYFGFQSQLDFYIGLVNNGFGLNQFCFDLESFVFFTMACSVRQIKHIFWEIISGKFRLESGKI